MMINTKITILEQDLIINRQVFEEVQHFRHSGALINSKNLISDERKSRIAVGNRFFFIV